jgi:DNA invertase Pin-like site-specific DNA recombinase
MSGSGIIGNMTTRKAPKGDMTKAIAYLRASKDEQRLSPEAQRASIEAWAKREGVAVVAWHVDHICSVTDIDGRDGLVAALADLRTHGAGVLVVAKRDRIARDVVLAATIEREVEKRGARIASVAGEGTEGNDPSSQLMRGVSDLFAQHERAMIRARTTAALAAKSAKGERVGSVRYGFHLGADGRTLEADAAEQEVIARVREAHAKGVSLRGIVAELEAAGIVGRTGRPLAVTQVRNIVVAA